MDVKIHPSRYGSDAADAAIYLQDGDKFRQAIRTSEIAMVSVSDEGQLKIVLKTGFTIGINVGPKQNVYKLAEQVADEIFNVRTYTELDDDEADDRGACKFCGNEVCEGECDES